jgi:anti-sigma factor RsiW
MIMAFADGELAPALARRVEDAIRADDTMRRKYEMFRCGRALLRDAFGGIADEPVPERLQQAILAYPERPKTAR